MLQWTVDKNRSNWNIIVFPALWAYRTSVKITTNFTPFQLVYGIEAFLPIECEIPLLKLAIELHPNTTELEKKIIYLDKLDENRRDVETSNEVHNHRIKS